jgi:hypothetical protein
VLIVIALWTFCANWVSFLEGIHDMKKYPFLDPPSDIDIYSLAVLISSRQSWPNFNKILMIYGGTFGLIAGNLAVDCFFFSNSNPRARIVNDEAFTMVEP